MEKAQPIADTKQLPEIDRRIDQLTKLKDKIFPAVMANIDKQSKKNSIANEKALANKKSRRGTMLRHV